MSQNMQENSAEYQRQLKKHKTLTGLLEKILYGKVAICTWGNNDQCKGFYMTEENKNTYIFSLSKLLLNYKPYTVQVERDGFTQEYKCVMAAFCNGTQFGGGIKLCPPAKNDDGKMDLMIVKPPKGPVLMAMPAFVAGQHIGKPWAEHVVCDKAKITVLNAAAIEIDGEIYNDSVLDAQIVPGGFKTFE
jgi:diacylglycerol kinase family enzyme